VLPEKEMLVVNYYKPSLVLVLCLCKPQVSGLSTYMYTWQYKHMISLAFPIYCYQTSWLALVNLLSSIVMLTYLPAYLLKVPALARCFFLALLARHVCQQAPRAIPPLTRIPHPHLSRA
jgi:hypothetical protein